MPRSLKVIEAIAVSEIGGMMRIWILEDSDWGDYCRKRFNGGTPMELIAHPERQTKFRANVYKSPNIFCDDLYFNSDLALREYFPDYVFLDHDLGNIDDGELKDGDDVVKNMVEHADRYNRAKGTPLKVIITTANTVAAKRMFDDLARAGYDADIISREHIFDNIYSWPWL